MSLPESLERAATELTGLADQIRPANGDPHRLLEELSSDQAGELLGWILGNESDVAEELVEAWSESDVGTSVLLGVSDAGMPKAGRKLLRRARHRLRSQGIEVAAPEVAAKPVRRVVAADDPFQAAHVSAPDFRGTRMGYLADRHPAGGARLFEIRFDEARGILEFKVYNAGRSKVRGFLRTLSSAQARRLFEVDRDALRALVRRASLAQPIDRPLPTAFVEWRGRLFGESVEKEKTPGELARAALGAEAVADDAFESCLAEIAEGRVGPWPPATTWVSERMDAGREAVEGLEGEARGAAIDRFVDGLAADLASETDLAQQQRRLEELAWIRWQSDEASMGRSLLATADLLGSDEDAALRLARSRVESLFAPFLGELRLIEEDALADVEDGDAVSEAG